MQHAASLGSPQKQLIWLRNSAPFLSWQMQLGLFNGRNRVLSSPQQSSLVISHLMFPTENKLQTSSLFPLCNISTFQGMSPYKYIIKKRQKKVLCTPTWSPNTICFGFVVFFSQANTKFNFYSCFCVWKDAKHVSKAGFLTSVLEIMYTLISFRS